jgi:hypothetical protein
VQQLFQWKKLLNIAHYESVFAALVNQHAIHMGDAVVCDMSRSTIFFHIISKGMILKK